MINVNPLLKKSSLIGAGVGTIGGYLLSQIDNRKLKELKKTNPELYKKIKRQRTLKYTLGGLGVGAGAGLGVGAGIHSWRRRQNKATGYTENFNTKDFDVFSADGDEINDIPTGPKQEKLFRHLSNHEAPPMDNIKKPLSVNEYFGGINVAVKLKEKAPSGRSRVMWVDFKGAPNPDSAMRQILDMAERKNVTIEKDSLKALKKRLIKRYNYF